MHKCSECDKKFEVKRYLTKHFQRIHGPNAKPKEEPVAHLKCSVCEKEFPRLSHLQRHQTTHFNIREFKCEFCKEEFSQKSHLTRHMLRKHEAEYLQQAGTSTISYTSCPKCGCLFKTSYEMETHRTTTHHRLRCHRCNQVIHGIEEMKKHEMKCRDESELCADCGATFSRMADLRSHQNSCRKLMQFECLHCHQMFRQRIQFDRHFKKLHFKNSKCGVCEILIENPIMKIKHGKDCEKKEICGFCGIENPGYFHVSRKHWNRLKKPSKQPEIEKTSETSIENPSEIAEKNNSEEPEKIVEDEEEQEKEEEDDDSIDPFFHDIEDFSKESLGIVEKQTEEEIMMVFEISPEIGAEKFEFKGKIPTELVEIYPELEETALVLLDNSGGKIRVQIPVQPKTHLMAENLKVWAENVIQI